MAAAPKPSFGPNSLAIVCEMSANKMQTIADLLLLTSDIRPVNTDGIASVRESYAKCKDNIVAKTKGLFIIARDVRAQLIAGKLKDVAHSLQELTSTVVNIIESCSHSAYLAAISESGCRQAIPGIVDKYKCQRAKFGIQHCCAKIQKVPLPELSSTLILDLSSDITKYLTVLTNASKLASEATKDQYEKEQYKLAIKCVTACTSALLISLRQFQRIRDEKCRQRCVSFSKSLVQSCEALVTFASEPEHIGTPAKLTQVGKETQNMVLAGGMSVASSCIQLCQVVRYAIYDPCSIINSRKLTTCCSSIIDSSKLLNRSLQESGSRNVLPSSVSCPHLNQTL